MYKSNISTKPITMAKVLATGKLPAESASLSILDKVVLAVNSALNYPDTIHRHRCDKSVGHFYQVCGKGTLTKQDCLALDAIFRKARWLDVQIIGYNDGWSVSLAADSNRDWKPVLNGKPVQSK